MTNFDDYACLYDLFYRGKNYRAECDYVIRLAEKYSDNPVSAILDIGCGTGGHLIHFARAGLKVVGFDLSNTMIKNARKKLANIKEGSVGTKIIMPKVKVGDARTYRDGQRYDSAVSMFAAMGYLTSNEDFMAGLKTARAHLNKNGLFIFDVWFGPTVLTEKPDTRVQEFKGDGMRTIRMVYPELNPLLQVVKVHYNILQLHRGKVIKEINEVHVMRFFFMQELRLLLKYAGFSLLKVCPFMNAGREPIVGDWNVSVVARAV